MIFMPALSLKEKKKRIYSNKQVRPAYYHLNRVLNVSRSWAILGRKEPGQVFFPLPSPSPIKNAILRLAPRYTTGTFPISIGPHCLMSQYTWPPRGLSDHKCPKSATSRPNKSVLQTRRSAVDLNTSASFKVKSKYKLASCDRIMLVPVGISVAAAGAEVAWVMVR